MRDYGAINRLISIGERYLMGFFRILVVLIIAVAGLNTVAVESLAVTAKIELVPHNSNSGSAYHLNKSSITMKSADSLQMSRIEQISYTVKPLINKCIPLEKSNPASGLDGKDVYCGEAVSTEIATIFELRENSRGWGDGDYSVKSSIAVSGKNESLSKSTSEHRKKDTGIVTDNDSVLKIIYSNKPPLVWKNEYDQLLGALVDIWQLWAEKNQRKIEFVEENELVELPLNSIYIGVSEIVADSGNVGDQIRLLPLLITTASMYQSGTSAINYKWGGYKNKRIALVKNQSFCKFLTNTIPNIRLVYYDDSESIIDDLESDKYDAFFMEDMVARRILEDHRKNTKANNNRMCSVKIRIVPEFAVEENNSHKETDRIAEVKQGFGRIPYEKINFILSVYNNDSAVLYPVFDDEESDWIKNAGKLLIGCRDNMGPMQEWEKNEVVGVIPELIRIIMYQAGIDFEYVKIGDNETDKEVLSSQEADVISYSIRQDDRSNIYSVPYLIQSSVAFVRDKADYIGDGKSIIAIPEIYGDSYLFLKEKYKHNTVIQTVSSEAALNMVRQKEADIAVLGEYHGEELYHEIDPNEISMTSQEGILIRYMMMASDNQNNQILMRILNKAIISLPDKRVNEILEKYKLHAELPINIYDLLITAEPWLLGFMIVVLGLWGLITRRALRKLHVSEENLKKEKVWLSATMHSIGDGVIATDEEGRILQINFIAEEMILVSKEQAIGESAGSLLNLYNSETGEKLIDPVGAVLKDKKLVVHRQNTVLRNRRGMEVPVIVNASPIFDGSSEVMLGVVLVIKDIRVEHVYRQQISQAKMILTNAIELAGVSYFVYDIPAGKITINTGKQETYLYIDNNFSLIDVFPNIVEDDYQQISLLWDKLRKRELGYFRANYTAKYRGRISYHRVEMRSEVDSNDDIVRVFGVRLNITDVVSAENVSRERLEQAYDLAKLIYYEYQPKLKIIKSNSKLNELFMLDDIESKAILIDDMLVNVGRMDKERLLSSINLIQDEKIAKLEQELIIRKKGRKRIVKLFVSNKFSDDNDWTGSSGCVLDITELNYVQRELEVSEEQKRLILGSIKEAVVYISSDLKIVWANESTYEMFDCSEIVPLSIQSNYIIYGGEHPSMLCNTISVMRGISDNLTESFSYNEKEVLVSLNPIRDEFGRITHMVKTFSDVSEFKEIQKNLKEAYDRAEMANKAKSTFLSTMTHEIRTPLNAIIGFSGLLQHEKLDSNSSSYANSIHTAATGLFSLINNVLDISRIEAEKMTINLAPVNLNDLMYEMDAIFNIKAKSKGIDLIIKTPDEISGLILDKDRLRQILINIIGNAVKFTNEGFVEVVAEFIAGSDYLSGTLQITVSDTGIGIPQEDQGRMFESFEQHENSSARQYEGTGLGLSISKRLVELMNGRITLNSEVGIGSEFKIILSGVELQGDGFEIDEKNPSANGIDKFTQERVLLVSDNQNDLTIIVSMLDKMGLKVETTSSLFDAIEILNEESFGLVINGIFDSDNSVDNLNSKMIMVADKTGTPVVALTGYSDPNEYFETSLYETIIIKPVTVEMFSEIMGRFFVRTDDFIDVDSEAMAEPEDDIHNLPDEVLRDVLKCFEPEFEKMSHGVVINQAREVADEFVAFAENYGEQPLLNIAKKFEQYVATYKLPDIMYIVKQFLKHKE